MIFVATTPQSIACSISNGNDKNGRDNGNYNWGNYNWGNYNCGNGGWTFVDKDVDNSQKIDLIAGGGNANSAQDVGDVTIWTDAKNLYVKYQITDKTPADASDNWYMTETHLEVATSLNGIPQANGNPVPGKFDYSKKHDYVTEYTYTIPKTWRNGTVLYIAAHAVVGNPGGLQGFNLALPDMVKFTAAPHSEGNLAFFYPVTVTGTGILQGTYKGWCIDTQHGIDSYAQYTGVVYSTYETLPAGTVDHPENLDLVNWIINQNLVGKRSPTGLGIYTYGDVQFAIWGLLEDTPYLGGLGTFDFMRSIEIYDAAVAKGEGYKPCAGKLEAVVLRPTNGDQIIVIEVPVKSVCSKSETAWAAVKVTSKCGQVSYNRDFSGKNWATYLKYRV